MGIPDYETNQDLDPIQDDLPLNERTPRGLALRSSSDNEEPVELQGLDDLPLERSKYYAILNDMENGKSISRFCTDFSLLKWSTVSFLKKYRIWIGKLWITTTLLLHSNQYVLNLYEWLCNPTFFYSFILCVKLQRKFCWLMYCLKGWNSKCRKVFRGKWTSSRIIIFMSGASFRKVNKNKSFPTENQLRPKVTYLLYHLITNIIRRKCHSHNLYSSN